ncbi:MAG TPA: hypothetical protein VMG12_34480 [Polyangiaceae bacterium]|nr:hypothetical protein [Polyangiaceae bacterium]
MRRVLQALDQRTEQFERAPLFEFLRNRQIPARERLSFAPCVAHFVMSFADLYAFVLPEEPTSDPYQELVNAHTKEDENHWRWFLADLAKLDCNPQLAFTDALRFIWSDATVQMRMLTYAMCRLGSNADSLTKLVLVHCIEAAGKVTVGHVSAVGGELMAQTDERLTYFGPHHSNAEADHTIEDVGVRHRLEEAHLQPDQRQALLRVVDESFVHFTNFTNEMLKFAKSGQTVNPG